MEGAFDHFCQLSGVAGLAIGKGVSSEDKRNTRLEAGVKFRCKLNQRRCFFSVGEMKSNLLLVISAKKSRFCLCSLWAIFARKTDPSGSE